MLEKAFHAKVQNVCGSQPFITRSTVYSAASASVSWWEKSARVAGGRHRGRRSCILRSRSGRGAFSSPASRRGGYVHPVHSAGTLSLPILSRDVPDRWNWAGSRSLICIHGTRSRRALPAGGGSSHIAVDYFRLRTFRWNPVSGQLGEDRAMLKPGNSTAEDEIHITLDKAIFIIMASYGPGLEFSGTLESAGLSLF